MDFGNGTQAGNPTRSDAVDDLIKKVELAEAREEGAEARDKRAYSHAEFLKILELFRMCNDFNHKFKYVAMTLWACHLIHRIDDTAHFKVGDPHGNVEHPFTIKTKTRWSKNVKKMRH